MMLRNLNATVIPTPVDRQDLSFEGWLTQYWYILLIVLAVLVVICVLVCACILRKQPSRNSSSSFQPPRSTHINVSDENGCSSSQQSASFPTMPSLSADSTPIPSPHSSQHSVRAPSSQGGAASNRSRSRTSPRLSSTSSDTLRPGANSVSSNSSSTSLMGGHNNSPSRQSPMERRGSFPRRTRSGPIVRVTSMPDVKGTGTGLRSAPSTVSVESSSSGRSGVSYRFQPTTDSDAVVEVGVTVHTPGDPDKAVRIATAAALAESARKLAQEAASFIDDEQPSFSTDHYHPKYIANHRPASGRSTYSHPSFPQYCTPSLTSHDHPHLSGENRFDIERRGGDYHMYNYPVHYSNRSNTSQFNDSDYHSYRASPTLDSNLSIPYVDPDPTYSSYHHPRFNPSFSYQQRLDHSLPLHQREHIPRRSFEFNYKPMYHRRSSDNTIQYRKPPNHLLSTNRRDVSHLNSFPSPKLPSLEKRLATPVSSPDIDDTAATTTTCTTMRESRKTRVYGNSPLPIVEADPPTISVLSVEPPHPILSHSASNSTGLSSTHTENGSQVEDVSPNPSQENSQSNNVTEVQSKKPLQLRLSSDSRASSDVSFAETEMQTDPKLTSKLKDQLSSEPSSTEVTQMETQPDNEPHTVGITLQNTTTSSDRTSIKQEQIELTTVNSNATGDAHCQDSVKIRSSSNVNMETENDPQSNRRQRKYLLNSDNMKFYDGKNRRETLKYVPEISRSYRLNRENMLSERTQLRQSSLSRFQRPYSPPADRGLSLSRQSYPIPYLLSSSFQSTPQTSTPADVTVDV